MKKRTSPSPENILSNPSPTNTFWFDAGRSYQVGLTLSLSKIKKLSRQEFTCQCQLFLIRYLDVGREDLVSEFYDAFKDGFEKGETMKDEGLKMVPWGIA